MAQDLKIVGPKFGTTLKHSLKLNKPFPDILLYGATKYGGIGLQSMESQHCYLKLMFFLRHIRFNDETGKMLSNTVAHTQMEIGVSIQFFSFQGTTI